MTMLGEGIVASPVACLDFPLLFLTVKVHNTSSPNFSLVKFFVEESDSGYGCGGEHPDPAHPNSLGPLLPPGLWAAPVFGPHFWTPIWEHFLTLLKKKKKKKPLWYSFRSATSRCRGPWTSNTFFPF